MYSSSGITQCSAPAGAPPVCPKASNTCGNKTELSETAFRLAEKKYKLFRLDPRASKRQTLEESDFSDVVDFQNFDSNTPSNKAMMRLVSEISVPLKNDNNGAARGGEESPPQSSVGGSQKEEHNEQCCKKYRTENVVASGATDATTTDTASTTEGVDDTNKNNTRDFRTQRCYTFDGVPGLLFFPGALTEKDQQYWCSEALDRYAQSPPFPNNITTLDERTVTKRYGGPHFKILLDSSAEEVGSPAANAAEPKMVPLPAAPKEKMRWATLGFKYNWTTKSYDPSKYCVFPSDLSKMIKDTFYTMLAPVAAHSMKKRAEDGSDNASEGPKTDAEAVAIATAKALELAKGLQGTPSQCKVAAAAAALLASSSSSPSPQAPSDVFGRNVGGQTECDTHNVTSTPSFSSSVTSNPKNLPPAAPITLLANAVAASHKDISNEEILSALLSPSYEPQTAIVNFFPLGSMMCAHQDLSEPCLHRPLISISLGASCIFLMGSTSREDPPHAFILRSGDIVAFTGPSRVAFHAVPRVLEDCPQHLVDFDGRMKDLRININVRQVYDEPQPQLADPMSP